MSFWMLLSNSYFLPFTCDACGGTFCLQHKSKDDHKCPKIEDKCSEYSGERSYQCSIEGCKRKELTQIICHHCNGSFCLNHRLQEDHKCPKLPEKKIDVSKTAQHVQQILAKKELKVKSKALTNPKSIQMAAKVNLMKLKGRAQGDCNIPQSERVFFKVMLPLESGKLAVEMFFSKMWVVGRVIDAIADRNSITNNNNTSCEKKLKLFHADTGICLQTNLSLQNIMEDASLLVYNGSSLILERVPDGDLTLECVDRYLR